MHSRLLTNKASCDKFKIMSGSVAPRSNLLWETEIYSYPLIA